MQLLIVALVANAGAEPSKGRDEFLPARLTADAPVVWLVQPAVPWLTSRQTYWQGSLATLDRICTRPEQSGVPHRLAVLL